MWDGKIPGLALGKYDGWAGYIECKYEEIYDQTEYSKRLHIWVSMFL